MVTPTADAGDGTRATARATARGRRHAFDGRQQAAWNAAELCFRFKLRAH